MCECCENDWDSEICTCSCASVLIDEDGYCRKCGHKVPFYEGGC